MNAVFGTAVGYKWENIKKFVVSLRNNNFEGDIVLFCDWFEEPEQEKLKQYNVKWVYGVHCRRGLDIFAARWGWYLEELKKYDMVFCSDVRDVVFQDDIGKYLSSGIHATEEAIVLDEDPVSNCDWMRKYYGRDVLDALRFEKVLCAGTVWGDSFTLRRWCRWVVSERDKMDQAMLMYAAYYGVLPFQLHSNGDIVWTLGMAKPNGHGYDYDFRDGKMTVNGIFAPVVHQFDREHLDISYYFEELYRGC